MVPEEELQKAATAIYGVMRDMKSGHPANAAMALGHAGLRVPLPFPSSSTGSAGMDPFVLKVTADPLHGCWAWDNYHKSE